jgi:hypothetical protein
MYGMSKNLHSSQYPPYSLKNANRTNPVYISSVENLP